jgi:hypothetical protein
MKLKKRFSNSRGAGGHQNELAFVFDRPRSYEGSTSDDQGRQRSKLRERTRLLSPSCIFVRERAHLFGTLAPMIGRIEARRLRHRGGIRKWANQL